jgi:hypothetical protein
MNLEHPVRYVTTRVSKCPRLFFVSESDLPDRTLHLRRIEFEKRRMRREIRRQKRRHGERDNEVLLLERQRGGDRQPEADDSPVHDIMPEVRRLRCADGGQGWPFMEVSALPGGDFSSSDKGSWVHQPINNEPLFSGGRRLQSGNRSISAFFPVKKERREVRRRSLMSTGGEEGDSSSFPSLPPPPVCSPPPPPCPATPAHHREGTLVQQPDKWGEKIPRLDLEDIWSDVTLPSQNGGAADLSQTSTQQDNHHHQSSSPSRLPPQSLPPSSVRSVGCDTGDLVMDSPVRRGDQWCGQGSRERIETPGGWVGDLSPLPEHQSSRSCRQPPTGGLSVTGGGGLRRALSAELSSILRWVG